MENAHHSHCYIQKELDAELLLSLAKPSTSLQKFETLIKAVNYTPTMESLAKAAVKILGNNKRPAPIHPSEHLSKNELESIFVSAATNSNILRAKRDLAILALFMDLQFSSQKISLLKLFHVQQMMENSIHVITCPVTGVNFACHPTTTLFVMDWLNSLEKEFNFGIPVITCKNMDPKNNLNQPLFISLQCCKDNNRNLARTLLKRDAVSKIFMAVKERSGISRCSREIFVASGYNVYSYHRIASVDYNQVWKKSLNIRESKIFEKYPRQKKLKMDHFPSFQWNEYKNKFQ